MSNLARRLDRLEHQAAQQAPPAITGEDLDRLNAEIRKLLAYTGTDPATLNRQSRLVALLQRVIDRREE